MVAIPNVLLDIMTDKDNARDWVRHNVSRYHFDGGVKIKYVAVGKERPELCRRRPPERQPA
jgi:hypothetical protein